MRFASWVWRVLAGRPVGKMWRCLAMKTNLIFFRLIAQTNGAISLNLLRQKLRPSSRHETLRAEAGNLDLQRRDPFRIDRHLPVPRQRNRLRDCQISHPLRDAFSANKMFSGLRSRRAEAPALPLTSIKDHAERGLNPLLTGMSGLVSRTRRKPLQTRLRTSPFLALASRGSKMMIFAAVSMDDGECQPSGQTCGRRRCHGIRRDELLYLSFAQRT